MSANFNKVFEVQSDVPIVAVKPPKNKKNPLALTIKVKGTGFELFKGVPSHFMGKIKKTETGEYDMEELHVYLVNLKKKHAEERDIVLEPVVDIDYEVIVKIMDSVRLYRNTDEEVWIKDKDGIDVKAKYLFDKIVFGNIRS